MSITEPRATRVAAGGARVRTGRSGERPDEGGGAHGGGADGTVAGSGPTGTDDQRSSPASVADVVVPVLDELVGPLPVRLEFWDGSTAGDRGSTTALVLRSPRALRRVLWAPGELGVARAFVEGDLDLDGDVVEAVSLLRPAGQRLAALGTGALRSVPRLVEAARRVGAFGPPLPHPPEEAHPTGIRHSRRRDAGTVGHHYDVGNDFYRLVLGPAMTYSCARFESDGSTLEDAQAAKHELVCRKLGLHERTGATLLDVGCGWGSLAIHAAVHHGARVVGVTISREQHAEARRRVADAGVEDLVDVRLVDYRDVGGSFDAVASVGMFEHVGSERADEYFSVLHSHLVPGGRLLNHAISKVGGTRLGRRSFFYRYVFPDAELMDVGEVVLRMESAGFEVRDVEGLREHYARTLRCWVARLESDWDRAVDLVGERRARVWRLYMAASAVGFEDGGLGIHQVLGVRVHPDGTSGMPATRDSWVRPAPAEPTIAARTGRRFARR